MATLKTVLSVDHRRQGKSHAMKLWAEAAKKAQPWRRVFLAQGANLNEIV